jgi:hypothetical protein
MTTDTITPDELPAFIARMPSVALDAAEGAMSQTLLFLHGQIPPYPGPAPKGETVKNMTPKARAWFFWVLKTGKLRLPYTRTGLLGQSFTTEVSRGADNVTGEIGTNVAYAPWVVGPKFPGREIHGQQMYQAKIHQGNWWDFEAEMDKARPQAADVFGQEWFSRFQAGL